MLSLLRMLNDFNAIYDDANRTLSSFGDMRFESTTILNEIDSVISGVLVVGRPSFRMQFWLQYELAADKSHQTNRLPFDVAADANKPCLWQSLRSTGLRHGAATAAFDVVPPSFVPFFAPPGVLVCVCVCLFIVYICFVSFRFVLFCGVK